MMNKKLAQLEKRRQLLIARASAQRSTLVQNVGPLRHTMAVADSTIRIVRYVKSHPILSLSAIAAFAYFQTKLAGRWLQRGVALFSTAQNIRKWLAKH